MRCEHDAAVAIQRAWRRYADRTLCRICYGSGGAAGVCGCASRAHPACVATWARVSGRRRCEICREPFDLGLASDAACIEVRVVVEGELPPAPRHDHWCRLVAIIAATFIFCALSMLLVDFAAHG